MCFTASLDIVFLLRAVKSWKFDSIDYFSDLFLYQRVRRRKWRRNRLLMCLAHFSDAVMDVVYKGQTILKNVGVWVDCVSKSSDSNYNNNDSRILDITAQVNLLHLLIFSMQNNFEISKRSKQHEYECRDIFMLINSCLQPQNCSVDIFMNRRTAIIYSKTNLCITV